MPHLLCLGDSITDCGRLFDFPPLGNGYVKLLEERLKHSGRVFTIENRGTDGFTLGQLARLVQRGALPGKADAVTLLIGINDMGLMMNTRRTHAQQEAMLEQFFSDYESLLGALSGPPLIVMEPFLFPRPAEYLTWFSLLEKMCLGIRGIAAQHGLPCLPLHTLFQEKARQCGPGALSPDGIHLTRTGHELLADLLFEELARIFPL